MPLQLPLPSWRRLHEGRAPRTRSYSHAGRSVTRPRCCGVSPVSPKGTAPDWGLVERREYLVPAGQTDPSAPSRITGTCPELLWWPRDGKSCTAERGGGALGGVGAARVAPVWLPLTTCKGVFGARSAAAVVQL